MGKLVWYQNTGEGYKEATHIDLGQVNLMADGTQWDDFTTVQVGYGETDDNGELYHAKVKFIWTGEYPLHDCKFVIKPSNNYTGSSDAELDIGEVQDWAYNGEHGWNRFPTACQIYNPCEIVLDDNEEAHPEGFYVISEDFCGGGDQTCTNLGEQSHKRCLPCIGNAGNIDNFNFEDEWPWYNPSTNLLGCTPFNPGDRRVMYTYSGGLLISQGEDDPDSSSWEQFNNASSEPYTIAMTGGTLQPETPYYLYLRMCVPWGCFCGGKRVIGFGLDYIYTK